MNSVDDYIWKYCNAPTHCPCCGTELVQDGVTLRCMNKQCSGQILFQLTHFIRKLGVDGANQKTLENLKLTSFEKLINFKANKAYKNEVKLEKEIYNKIFTQPKEKLFCAMNFNGLSEILLNKIVEFVGFEDIENKRVKNTYNFPVGIGQTLFDRFLEDYQENVDIVNMIIHNPKYHLMETTPSGPEIKSNGMSVCFTGSLNTMTRAEASKKAMHAGYKVKGGVNKGLTYLVTNDKNSGSSKNKKAAQLGIKVINEEEFIKLVLNIFDDSLTTL